MCHERRPLQIGQRLPGSAQIVVDGGLLTPGAQLQPGRNLTTSAALDDFSDAALLKVISLLQAKDTITTAQLRLLKDARALLDRRRNPAVGGIDPELVKLREELDRKQRIEDEVKRDEDRIFGPLGSLTDSADKTTPTLPAKTYELVLTYIGGVSKKAAEVIVKSLVGDPLNSGGDVVPTGPLGPTKQGPKNDNPPGPTRPALPR